MARRPVFSVSQGGYPLFDCEEIGFPYFNGFSTAQKQRCIRSLHQAYLEKHPQAKLLEISSQSETGLGVRLSAFHLTRTLQSGKCVPVEVAFQAGKRFEHGGSYADLLDVPPGKAKNDGRLKNSGDIIGFTCDGVGFAAEPKTFFYNWLYITALQEHRGLLEGLLEYDAFTDIAFNPQKSLNCQAEAAAICVSLHRRGQLQAALASPQSFLDAVYRPQTEEAPRQLAFEL